MRAGVTFHDRLAALHLELVFGCLMERWYGAGESLLGMRLNLNVMTQVVIIVMIVITFNSLEVNSIDDGLSHPVDGMQRIVALTLLCQCSQFLP